MDFLPPSHNFAKISKMNEAKGSTTQLAIAESAHIDIYQRYGDTMRFN